VLADLGGRPLVQHAYERASAARLVASVVVATDSGEVERAVLAFGGRVVRVDAPCATGSDRVAAAARGLPGDPVVNLQADQPCVDPRDIDRVVRALDERPDFDLSTLAFRSDDPAEHGSRDVVKVVVAADGRALYFSRAGIPSCRRDAEGTRSGQARPWFLHHVGIYCFRRAALERFASLAPGALEERESLEQLRALENGMSVGVVVSDARSVGVDRAADLERAARALSGMGPEAATGADHR
jgi:3-deoxy-manno-octulosonate cytidylyltransferase (CMP-KDO synthetase)